MSEEFQLPENLAYTATAESGDHARKCNQCGEDHHCRRYILRFPEDAQFLEWEKGKSRVPIHVRKNIAYVPYKPPRGDAIDGFFCSENCALRSYFPIYVQWRLSGGK